MSRKKDEIVRLLRNHHRRLQALEERKALYGLDAPISILTEIEDTKAEIEKLQSQLNELELRVDNLESKAEKSEAEHLIESEVVRDYPHWMWIGAGLITLVAAVGLIVFFVGGGSADGNQNNGGESQATSAPLTSIDPTIPPTIPPTNTPRYQTKLWIPVQSNDWESLNEEAYFKVGYEEAFGEKRDLYLCRAEHDGAMIPGKVVESHCNIAVGNDLDGTEAMKTTFEVFQGKDLLEWKPMSEQTLKDFYLIGEEHGRPLGACRVEYKEGIHPGKLVDEKCFISYNHSVLQLSERDYDVLVKK